MGKSIDTTSVQFADFLNTSRWPQLDGLRTVSIALVLVVHMGDPWWPPFKGALAVVLFFVISGYLITTLLIREEWRTGRVSLKAFYLRRAFRILPLYLLALTLSAVLVLGLDLGEGTDGFLARLPLLATLNGDLAGSGVFVHSWSIGVEEKFYILWPLLGFSLLALRRHRGGLLLVLLLLVSAAAYIQPISYLGTYTGIVAGCALATAMHTERGFRVVSRLSGPRVGSVLLVLAVVAFLTDSRMPMAEESGLAHVPFAIAAALAFPTIIIGRGTAARVLAHPTLVKLGWRAYGLYLFHPICIDVIGQAIPAGQETAGLALVRFVLAAALSLGVAEALYRTVEQPAIRVGRRISGRYQGTGLVTTN